jgi:hypothetical protein
MHFYFMKGNEATAVLEGPDALVDGDGGWLFRGIEITEGVAGESKRA